MGLFALLFPPLLPVGIAERGEEGVPPFLLLLLFRPLGTLLHPQLLEKCLVPHPGLFVRGFAFLRLLARLFTTHLFALPLSLLFSPFFVLLLFAAVQFLLALLLLPLPLALLAAPLDRSS